MTPIQKKYQFAVIATDVAVFTIQNDQLHVLLIRMKKKPFTDQWALPGGLVDPRESVDAAAARILQLKTGVNNVYLEQLATFGRVDRDPFGRVVSVAYFAVASQVKTPVVTTAEYTEVAWFPVKEVQQLAYDHDEMLQVAIKQLRQRLDYSAIAVTLLPRQFTLTQLQQVYEIILSKSLDKRNFRKRMLALGLLQPTGKQQRGQSNRPAALYRFTAGQGGGRLK